MNISSNVQSTIRSHRFPTAGHEDVINLAFRSIISWMPRGYIAGLVSEQGIGNDQIIRHGQQKKPWFPATSCSKIKQANGRLSIGYHSGVKKPLIKVRSGFGTFLSVKVRSWQKKFKIICFTVRYISGRSINCNNW